MSERVVILLSRTEGSTSASLASLSSSLTLSQSSSSDWLVSDSKTGDCLIGERCLVGEERRCFRSIMFGRLNTPPKGLFDGVIVGIDEYSEGASTQGSSLDVESPSFFSKLSLRPNVDAITGITEAKPTIAGSGDWVSRSKYERRDGVMEIEFETADEFREW